MLPKYWSASGFINGRPEMDRLLFQRIASAMTRLGISVTSRSTAEGYYEVFAGVEVDWGSPGPCHIPGCGREPLVDMIVCGPCRLSYLNGVSDGSRGVKRDKSQCQACGHWIHPGTRCGWHAGSCGEAATDPALWCPCDGTSARWGGN